MMLLLLSTFGMKSTILIYEKLSMIPGSFTIKGCKNRNQKRIRMSLFKASTLAKMARQILQAVRTDKQDKNKEKFWKLYESGGF